jgi:dolichol-phosphate mannosyltransferase
MDIQTSQVLLSVIIPIFNEEENIPELYRRLTHVLGGLCAQEGHSRDDYEIIMVDDGSMDNSWALIKDLHEKDPRVKGISFSRNFGHHIAVLAGIDHCKGRYTVFMDGDLQDRPEDISLLFEKIKEGYDIVQGINPRRHANLIKNLFSRLFSKLFIKVSTVDPMTRTGLFRCVNRAVIDSLKRIPERAIFFGGIISWIGFKTTHVNISRSKRHAGRSKYSFMRRFALAVNAITSFSERPLVLIFQLGMLVFVISIFMFAYTVFRKVYYGISIMGWASLFAAIFFSTGLITLSLSVVGLYISKLFIEAKQRPRYIVREQLK